MVTPAAGVYAKMREAGVSMADIVSMVERDEWVYSDGPSMVCDVFVCSVYKAAGLFGDLKDELQCTEFQNWDVETLNVFNTAPVRPQAVRIHSGHATA